MFPVFTICHLLYCDVLSSVHPIAAMFVYGGVQFHLWEIAVMARVTSSDQLARESQSRK